jgi:hypothetical protein
MTRTSSFAFALHFPEFRDEPLKSMRMASSFVFAAVFAAGCVDPVQTSPKIQAVGSITASGGGIPQRLWERYVLVDLHGNVTPAVYSASDTVQLRVMADTLFFTFATSEFREVARVIRHSDTKEDTLTLTTPRGARYTQSAAETVTFPSLIFGTTSATLTGATRTVAFSRNLVTTVGAGNYIFAF